MARPEQILTTKLETCRPKYTNKLITELKSLVHNPPFHTLYDNDGLQGGSTDFRGSKLQGQKAFLNSPEAPSMLALVIVDNSDVATTQSKKNEVSMENGVIPCNSNSNLDIEDTKARADVNGVLKMVKQKKKLNAKMRDLKQKMNTK